MAKHDEMTRYAFISHMEDYMKKLLTDPLKADTDEFLKGHGIDGPKAMEILTKRVDPNDENSSIVIKKASIKDNGVDVELNVGEGMTHVYAIYPLVPESKEAFKHIVEIILD